MVNTSGFRTDVGRRSRVCLVKIVKIAFCLKSLQVLVFMALGIEVHDKEDCEPRGLKGFDCCNEVLNQFFSWSWGNKLLRSTEVFVFAAECAANGPN